MHRLAIPVATLLYLLNSARAQSSIIQFVPSPKLSAEQINAAQKSKVDTTNGTAVNLNMTGGTLSQTRADGAFVQSTGGQTLRTLAARFGQELNLLDFGADPTDTIDSTAAVQSWVNACISTGKACHFNWGTYKITSGIDVDLSTISPHGIRMYGDGQQRSKLDGATASAFPLFKVHADGVGAAGAFYSDFRDFQIQGAVAGPIAQFGNDDLSDALNSFTMENLWFGNNSTSSSAVALRLNYVLTFHLSNVVAQNNGAGDACQIYAMRFSSTNGLACGWGNINLHMTGASDTYGNTFAGSDFEALADGGTDIQIDNANARQNTFVGGTFVYNPNVGTSQSWALNFTAGYDNYVVGGNFHPYPNGANTYALAVESGTGLTMLGGFGQVYGWLGAHPTFAYYPGSNASLTSGTWTRVVFDTASFSKGEAAFVSSIFTVPPGKGGAYRVHCHIQANTAVTSNSVGYAAIYNEKSAANAKVTQVEFLAGSGQQALDVDALINASSGDQYSCWANIPGTSPVINGGNVNSWFDASYLGN